MKKSIFNFTFIILLIVIILSSGKEIIPLRAYDYDVTIHRDNWGVPHIYGNTDKDVAYGLAYAHAEDDFKTIQDVLLALRGKSASIYGKKNAPIDYLVGLLKVWKTVEEYYETDISEEVKNICDGYADGINHYMEKHPSESIDILYPVKGKDLIAGFVFRTPLMFELDWYIRELLKETKPSFENTRYANRNTEFSMYGSNIIAVGPKRSADGFTRITTNSHQPWSGPVSWYEAHLHSNQGWNISGGLFPGSPVIFKGYNDSLAWSHTVNDPDLVDVYELTINPNNPYQYLLENKWIDFEKEILPITVKILGPIKWTFKRELLWSEHGPVIKSSHGIYALRYSASNKIGQIEQWFRMNKAKNLSEFKDAMKMLQIPMFNTIYADNKGNLFYIYNALIPKRKAGYSWSGILPGDKKDLIWEAYYKYEELPQVTNPSSGYLQNCNSTPYLVTVGEDNPKRTLPNHSGIEEFQTNRAFRANELYGTDKSINKDEFYSYKYDTYYSKKSVMKHILDRFLNEIQTDDPNLIEGIELLKNWDLGNQKYNKSAALALLTFKLKYNLNDYIYDYQAILTKFKEAIIFLNSEFGRIDIPLGNLQILKRGDLELPLDGGPDILRAIYSKMNNNRRTATGGDCFFQIIEWDNYGKVSAKSIHQFGSATNDEKSIHYSDQSRLFSNMEMKPSFIELDSIKLYIKSSYTP
tara:strand:+ start:686 stop:2773 length:2088 start_codon:yes stop_codon:yes gene_type:complete